MTKQESIPVDAYHLLLWFLGGLLVPGGMALPSLPYEQTDMCKNITLPQLRNDAMVKTISLIGQSMEHGFKK